MLVSLADKLHNARAILLDYRAIGEPLWQRFNPREREPVLWYYRGLHAAFAAREDLSAGAAALVAELGPRRSTSSCQKPPPARDPTERGEA